MKKIKCAMTGSDYAKVKVDNDGDVCLSIVEDNEKKMIFLTSETTRKLRKQLKKALVQIEGEASGECGCCNDEEPKSEYKPGDRIYLIEGDGKGDDLAKSPKVVLADISRPVELIKKINGLWSIRYYTADGQQPIGYAYEKSFGRRA